MKKTQKTKTDLGTLRIKISGYLFSESLRDEFIKTEIKKLGGIIIMPRRENDIIFIDFPEENKEKIKHFLLVNDIKTLAINKIGG